MKAASILNMVKRFTAQYGVPITWVEQGTAINSRGQPIPGTQSINKSAVALLLKQKFDPLQVITTQLGLGQDYTRYVVALPDVELKKDTIITDNHGKKWKLGIVDWFDVGGIPVAKQATVLEVQ